MSPKFVECRRSLPFCAGPSLEVCDSVMLQNLEVFPYALRFLYTATCSIAKSPIILFDVLLRHDLIILLSEGICNVSGAVMVSLLARG